MTKKSRSYILLISLYLVLFSVIVFIKPSIINTKRKTISVNYSYFPMDLKTLNSESDIIVKGIVKDTSSSYQGKVACIIDETGDNIGYNKDAEEAYANGADIVFIVPNSEAANKVTEEFEKANGLVYTDKIICVSQYYKNNLGLDEIIVRETGGNTSNKACQVSNETRLVIGDEVILFLKKLNSNKYVILGGPQGKYFIQGNNAINEMPEKSTSLNELEAEITS